MSTASDPVCPKCRVTMERGYCIDRGHANAQLREEWAHGEPQSARFLFMTYTKSAGKEDRVVVVTWRCPQCSLLESYAPRT
jgi:hypothetical protein